jgi:hypothetical protein
MTELSRRGFFGAVASTVVVGNPPAGGETYRELSKRIDWASRELKNVLKGWPVYNPETYRVIELTPEQYDYFLPHYDPNPTQTFAIAGEAKRDAKG